MTKNITLEGMCKNKTDITQSKLSSYDFRHCIFHCDGLNDSCPNYSPMTKDDVQEWKKDYILINVN